ncbi:hypothetical protein A0J61_10388 [Choanephora cucurbitarum]|uniref:CCHC-type domain-containing protein n=1 Tax=Choanephora cucurbitarum TaxID=101091 RepID=A0A1C7MXM1_9FUNG|nr:hypothetical protein A0J61_10388 [Choanephora cucurbitarum]
MAQINMLAAGVIRIPEFNEEVDPSQWLKTFESNMNAIKVDDEQKLSLVTGYLSPTLISGWYYQHDFKDWSEFKIKLIERFQAPKINMNMLLGNILLAKRQDQETIKDFNIRFDQLISIYDRARTKAEGWESINAKVLKNTYIDGLKPHYLKIVVKQHVPKDLIEAQRIALRDCDDAEEVVTLLNVVKGATADQSFKDDNMYLKDKPYKKQDLTSDKKQKEMERKVDDLTAHLQKLTLLVERGQATAKSLCYNCQEVGHVAQSCPKACKLCQGQLGDHPFWKCSKYERRATTNTYLIMRPNKECTDQNYTETYAVEKRKQESESERDVRVSRSGKRDKVHDTLPSHIKEFRKEKAKAKQVASEQRKLSKGVEVKLMS